MSNSGVYITKCRGTLYVGSSFNFKKRWQDHRWSLRKGIHKNPKLQEAFNECGDVMNYCVESIPRLDGESVVKWRHRLRKAEQKVLDRVWGDPCISNISPNSLGPNNGELLRRAWTDGAFRKNMIQMLKSRVASDTTRKLMGEAKRGVRNPKARHVLLRKDGAPLFYFATATDCGRFFGVTQQLADLWLKRGWPTKGSPWRVTKKSRHVTDYCCEFVDEIDMSLLWSEAAGVCPRR